MGIHGIHHITAISSNPQRTYDFYSHILGLRLVKKSVNQDDPGTYHLFFGDSQGTPGMDLTFFPFAGVMKGQRGNGLVTMISLEVPVGSLAFWQKRFKELKVRQEEIVEQFGYKRFTFYDKDGQQLELVEVEKIDKVFKDNVWTKVIPQEYAIHCFHSATLSTLTMDVLAPVLDLFGYKQGEHDRQNYQFRLSDKVSAGFLIVEEKPSIEPAVNGYGTVHHIAFQVKDRAEQEAMRDQLIKIGEQPTHVIDRFYFTSVYFRNNSGILFEIATEGPGFTADEEESVLGEKLALPPFLEQHRKIIEDNLEPIKTS